MVHLLVSQRVVNSKYCGQATNQNGGAAGGIITNAVSNLGKTWFKTGIIRRIWIRFWCYCWKGRVGINASYFERTSKDLIVFKPLPISTGYILTQDNIRKIEGKGIEVDLDLEMFEILPVNVDGSTWNAH